MSSKGKATFTGRFGHYTPINQVPYYVLLHGEWRYLIKCIDYPMYIGLLAPNDIVAIEAEFKEKCDEGIILTNVKWSLLK